MAVVLIATAAVPAAFAATYQISDGLKFQLETEEVYLAGIEDDRTTLDVPSAMNGYPVTATTMDFAQNNANLESVTFANAENISIIGSYGFYNCTNLRTVNLGSYVTELYRGVFRGCTSLETVELSDKITEIPYECFYGCTSLGQITLDRTKSQRFPTSAFTDVHRSDKLRLTGILLRFNQIHSPVVLI